MKTKLMLVVILLLSTSCQCLAQTYNYMVNYRCTSETESGWKMYFNADEYYSDGYDGEAIMYPYPSLVEINLGIYKVNGIDGWNGPTGFYVTDHRSPLSAGGKVIENIYVWARTGVSSRDINFFQPYPPNLPTGLSYKLSLVSIPNGITYTGPREWGPDHGTITLPFYSTDDGLTGYHFQAEITAVPEPSSLLALAGGLAGVGGTLLRRRKQS